jgi:opacity protein-like surface antigen
VRERVTVRERLLRNIRTTRRLAGLMLGLAGVWGTGVAEEEHASSTDGNGPTPIFEVAAFGSISLGGSFRLQGTNGSGGGSDSASLADRGSFAAAFDLRADQTQYELFYSRESTNLGGNATFPRTDVTIEYLHVGGTVLLDDQPAIAPYMVGGLGATRFSPGAQGNTDTRFSVSLGLGLRWPVNQHFSVRVEGRAFLTFVNPDTAIFCQSDQAGLLCRIHGHGQTFLQGQLLAGVAYAF